MVGKNLNSSLEKAQEILHAVEALRPGDRVVVLWHDACRVTNDPDVRPEYYSTPKETQGTVYDCVPDPEYPTVFYLIVSGETTAGKADYYDAIPVAWIAKIEKLEVAIIKQQRKEKKAEAEEYTVRRVVVFREGRLMNDFEELEDSHGRKVAKRFVLDNRTPVKYVERVDKKVL